MKANGGVDVYSHDLFTSALDGVEWSASRSDRFTPAEKPAYTLWLGGWVGLRSGLDDVENILDTIRTRTRTPQLSSP
jgi:hypothetical protein